jgi:hypothetical protein
MPLLNPSAKVPKAPAMQKPKPAPKPKSIDAKPKSAKSAPKAASTTPKKKPAPKPVDRSKFPPPVILQPAVPTKLNRQKLRKIVEQVKRDYYAKKQLAKG